MHLTMCPSIKLKCSVITYQPGKVVQINRATSIQWLGAGLVMSGLPLNTTAGVADKPSQARWLDLQRGQDRYLVNLNEPAGLAKATWLLRDPTAEQTGVPDAQLLLLLVALQNTLEQKGQGRVIQVSSGLRTPQTNAQTEGAATRSMHLPNENGVFKAVDLSGSPERLEWYYALLDPLPGLGLGRYAGHLHIDTRGQTARW